MHKPFKHRGGYRRSHKHNMWKHQIYLVGVTDIL